MSIFKFIEDDNFEGFKKYIIKNNDSLITLDGDGWGVLPLLVHYNMPEYIDFILPLIDKKTANLAHPIHPLFVALEHDDFFLIEQLAKSDKIDCNTTHKNNENIVHYLVHRNHSDLALKILHNDKISDVFTNSLDNNQLLSLCISKGYNSIVEFIVDSEQFKQHYDNKFLLQSVQHGNSVAFEQVYTVFEDLKSKPPHDQLQPDELFNFAINCKNINVVNFLLNTGDIIPGQQQITELIELITKVYENPIQQQSANDIIDFLFAIKTNFNKFVNLDGENVWILTIKNNNNYLFEKLVNENNESLEFQNSNNQTPLFFAIEDLNLPYVQKLLSRKADPTHLDYLKNNALIFAIGQECTTVDELQTRKDIVDAILEYRNDLNHINKNNESALSLAIHKKDMNIVSSLMWKGANLLHNPAKFIHQQDMFQFGTNGTFEMSEPIVEEKTIDNFIALKQLGFNLSQTNEKGDSLAMFFLKEGYLSNFLAMFKLLSNQEINAIDNDGNSLIMNAVKKKTDDYALKILFYFNNINLDTINKEGETAYDICAKLGNAKKMEALINNDNNLTSEKIQKALPLLIKYCDISKYWKEFLSIEPSINTFKDSERNDLIMLAAAQANFDNVYFLINQNVQFNTKEINLQKQTVLDILVALSEDHETNVANTLNLLTKKTKKQP